jgi:signal transduction histidine kinase
VTHLPHGGPPPGAATAPHTQSILVVDDERPIVELLLRALHQRGHRARGVHSAEAAKVCVREDASIAVVVSDVRMPGQDGLSLAEDLLRERAEAEAIEIVLLTGAASTDVALAALRARSFDLVQKPVRMAEVAGVVDRALASSRARRAHALRIAEVEVRIQAAEADRARLSERLAASAARLDDAETALNASHRMRRDLLAVISHEMRSPLIPILGFSEILAGALPGNPALRSEDVRDYGRMIHGGAERLLALIDSALDCVALEHGRKLGTTVVQAAGALLERVAQRLAPAATARGVTLHAAAGGDLAVAGETRLLEAALGHLLDNAIKASAPGAGIELDCICALDGAAVLRVLDRGTGLPQSLAVLLGTPFLQADMSASRAWPGAGLGLALATRVAAAHGGRLELRPRPGGGTEARLELPAARGAAA